MRAAVYYGVNDVRLEDVDEPEVGPGQVKLRVAYNGLCGTDLHEVFDSQRAIPSAPHPLTGARAPLIFGHEIGGVVMEIGEGIDDVSIGTLVSVEPLRGCGICSSCRTGDLNLCEQLAFHGLSTGGGGLAEMTVVDRSMIHKVPDGISPQQAAMAEPLSVAWHAVERSGAESGQWAAVLGGGPIGIGICLTLGLRGVEVLVVEPSPTRRAVITALGGQAIDPQLAPLPDQISDRIGKQDVDICFETSGETASFANALAATSRHGAIVVVASPRQPLPPILGQALAKELEIRTTYAYHGESPTVLDAMAGGHYPLEGWVTTRPMTHLLSTLGDLRSGRLLKVLVDPSS